MGIREEIEKLQKDPNKQWVRNMGGIGTQRKEPLIVKSYNIALEDVISILNEWEYMGGHTFRSPELAELDIFDGPCPPGRARTIEFNPGDRIVIWRKK